MLFAMQNKFQHFLWRVDNFFESFKTAQLTQRFLECVASRAFKLGVGSDDVRTCPEPLAMSII